MNIVVCVKFVREELVGGKSGNSGEYSMNPYDLFALEAAIRCKAVWGGHITCISMGAEVIQKSLSKCLALGADDVVWLKDTAFSGSDTVATSNVLYHAIKEHLKYNLLMCGGMSVDGETGQVPAGLADHLNIRYIPGVKEIINIDDSTLTIKTVRGNFETIMAVGLPAVISFSDFTINSTICPSLLDIKRARKKENKIYTLKELQLSCQQCGLKGSKTKVLATEAIMHKKKGIHLKGESMKGAEIIHNIIIKK